MTTFDSMLGDIDAALDSVAQGNCDVSGDCLPRLASLTSTGFNAISGFLNLCIGEDPCILERRFMVNYQGSLYLYPTADPAALPMESFNLNPPAFAHVHELSWLPNGFEISGHSSKAQSAVKTLRFSAASHALKMIWIESISSVIATPMFALKAHIKTNATSTRSAPISSANRFPTHMFNSSPQPIVHDSPVFRSTPSPSLGSQSPRLVHHPHVAGVVHSHSPLRQGQSANVFPWRDERCGHHVPHPQQIPQPFPQSYEFLHEEPEQPIIYGGDRRQPSGVRSRASDECTRYESNDTMSAGSQQMTFTHVQAEQNRQHWIPSLRRESIDSATSAGTSTLWASPSTPAKSARGSNSIFSGSSSQKEKAKAKRGLTNDMLSAGIDRMPPRVCDLLDCTLSGYKNDAVVKTGASDEVAVQKRFVVLIGSELHLFPTSEPLELLPVGAVSPGSIIHFALSVELKPLCWRRKASQLWKFGWRQFEFLMKNVCVSILCEENGAAQDADVERQRRKLLGENSSASKILPALSGAIQKNTGPFYWPPLSSTKSFSRDSNTSLLLLQKLQNMPLPVPAFSNPRTETASTTVKIENLTQHSYEFQMRGFNAFATEIQPGQKRHPQAVDADTRCHSYPVWIIRRCNHFLERPAISLERTSSIESDFNEARQCPVRRAASPKPGSKVSSPRGSPHGSPTASKGVLQDTLHGASQLRMDNGGTLKMARTAVSVSTRLRAGDAESTGMSAVATSPSIAFPEACGINCLVLEVRKN
ncbi:hypothetical protein BC830DRAFT_1082508 [Chytriomyces sp. MP71]|nr:hypothetical protein BC830DRAFT_1082508 [Chytriomyces sp. MP71]